MSLSESRKELAAIAALPLAVDPLIVRVARNPARNPGRRPARRSQRRRTTTAWTKRGTLPVSPAPSDLARARSRRWRQPGYDSPLHVPRPNQWAGEDQRRGPIGRWKERFWSGNGPTSVKHQGCLVLPSSDRAGPALQRLQLSVRPLSRQVRGHPRSLAWRLDPEPDLLRRTRLASASRGAIQCHARDVPLLAHSQLYAHSGAQRTRRRARGDRCLSATPKVARLAQPESTERWVNGSIRSSEVNGVAAHPPLLQVADLPLGGIRQHGILSRRSSPPIDNASGAEKRHVAGLEAKQRCSLTSPIRAALSRGWRSSAHPPPCGESVAIASLRRLRERE
jgi:hypothetical protein